MSGDSVGSVTTLVAAGATRAMDAAEAEARARGLKLGIAVADAAGNLLAFLRMDGAPIVTIEVAIEKARTAAQLGAPTKLFQDMTDNGRPSMLAVRNMMPVEGGVPVIIDGEVVGAVGASGAQSADDALVAQAGAAAVQAPA